jgi:hypothetical protein
MSGSWVESLYQDNHHDADFQLLYVTPLLIAAFSAPYEAS